MPRLIASLFLTFGLFLANAGASSPQGAVHTPGHTQQSKRPNFVFLLTDDQDLHLNSLDYMPNLQRLIGDEGTVFERHFCTIAVCCPSRVSLMTGKLAHNTNVTDVVPPYGMTSNPSLLSTKIANIYKVDIRNLCQKAITRTTCPSGSRMRATTRIIPANS